MVITAERVIAILKDGYKVAKSNLLPAGQRQDFLDELAKAVEDAENAPAEQTQVPTEGRRRRG
jgi:hypothetical protein